jgi:hypothetical protein
MARPYRPSGKSEPGALFKLLVASLIAGAVAGGVEGVVMHLGFNLFLVFPAAIGFVVGLVGARIVRSGKIRAPGQAALVVGLAALLGQAVTHIAEYALWRREARQGVVDSRDADLARPELPDAARAELLALDPDAEIDAYLQSEVGASGFLGYLQLASKSGIRIGRVGDSDEGKPTLTGVGTYVLWGAEFFIALLVGFSMAYSKAREPFCELCKSWYSQTVLLAVGDGSKAHVKLLVRALDSEDFERTLSAEVLGEPAAGLTSVLALDRCATCDEHEPVLSLKVVRESRGKAQTAERYRSLLRSEDARRLMAMADERSRALAAESPAPGSST